MVFNRLGIDQNVVHVYGHEAFINELLENVIHHGLEGSRAVGETEVHDQGFEKSTVHLEGCFPLITLFDAHIVISPMYVQLHEVLGFGFRNLVDNIGDEGEWVGVLHCHGIELPVVLHEPELTLLLINKEDWGCHGRFQRVDSTTCKILLQELVEFFLFNWGHWVYLCTEGLCSRNKVDCMVPLFLLGESVKRLFGEDVSKSMVRFWQYILKACRGRSVPGCLSKLCGDCRRGVHPF